MKNNSGFLKDLSNSKYFLILLIYLGFGILAFAARYTTRTYFDMLLYTISDPLFLMLFFFPATLALSLLFYQKMYQVNLILRFSNRKDYYKFLLKEWFKIHIFFFLTLVVLLLIIHNLICPNSVVIDDRIGKPNNLSILIVSLLQLYLFSNLIGLFTLFLSFGKRKQNRNVLFLIILGTLIYISSLFTTKRILKNIWLPFHYLSGWKAFPRIEWNIGLNLLFYGAVISILVFGLNQKIKQKDVVGDDNAGTAKA